MRKIIKIAALVGSVVFSNQSLASNCFNMHLECMYNTYKVSDQELKQEVGYDASLNDETGKLADAFSPSSGKAFINPNNNKQVITHFKLGEVAEYYFRQDDKYTVDLDLVTNSSKVKLKKIKHNLSNLNVSKDIDFGDSSSSTTSTLYIDDPSNLDRYKTYYIIYEFEQDVTPYEHTFNWQLGYQTEIFTQSGLDSYLNLIRANESTATYHLKASQVRGYVWLKRNECTAMNAINACGSFGLTTSLTYPFKENEYTRWQNLKWSEVKTISSFYKKLLIRTAERANQISTFSLNN